MIEPTAAAESLAEAAALPDVPVPPLSPEQIAAFCGNDTPSLPVLGAAVHIENPSGDNRTPARVLIYDAAGRESVLDGVVGFSVDAVRGVLTLELRPEHLHVEQVAAPAA